MPCPLLPSKAAFGDRRGVIATTASYWIAEDKGVSKAFSKTRICVTYLRAEQLGRRWRVRQREEMERRNAFELTTRNAIWGRREFLIWIRCNPLKSPDSAKEKQGNPSLFPWFYLVLLRFIWKGFTARL
jgi:hypothetical protein